MWRNEEPKKDAATGKWQWAGLIHGLGADRRRIKSASSFWFSVQFATEASPGSSWTMTSPLVLRAMDALFAIIDDNGYEEQWDFNSDSDVDHDLSDATADTYVFVRLVLSTFFGDVNLDGIVDARDLHKIGQRWQMDLSA